MAIKVNCNANKDNEQASLTGKDMGNFKIYTCIGKGSKKPYTAFNMTNMDKALIICGSINGTMMMLRKDRLINCKLIEKEITISLKNTSW